jgi:hypothetical protein
MDYAGMSDVDIWLDIADDAGRAIGRLVSLTKGAYFGRVEA